MKKATLVRILVKGGILTPAHLLSILKAARAAGKKYIHFGSRQDILLEVNNKQSGDLCEKFENIRNDIIPHKTRGENAQNIVTSYVSSDIAPATAWVSSGSYLFVLELFNFKPTLRINIADPKQSLVPLFYGDLNFVASEQKDFWYLYVRRKEDSAPERWPVLVLTQDIPVLSRRIEEKWNIFKRESFSGFFNILQHELDYTWRKIENGLKLDYSFPQDYEGFGKMYNSSHYWAGFYWRNNSYDISFLEEVCHLCLSLNISKICLTPWKSFLVKDIREKDLFHWHRLIGRFGINMRHSSFELNWHVPLLNKEALHLKHFIVKKFDKVDVCVHGLTFGIKTKSDIPFSSIIIEKVSGLKFLKKFDPFGYYKVLHAQNFNANTSVYTEFMSNIPRHRLPEILQNVTGKFYAQWINEAAKADSKIVIEKERKQRVYQCMHCFSIYDETTGDTLNGISPGTLFRDLPDTFTCQLCNAPKKSFKEADMNVIIKNANV